MKKYLRFVAVASFFAAITLLSSGCSQQTTKPSDRSDDSASADQSANQMKPSSPGSEESLDSSPSGMQTLTILEGRTTGPMLPIYFDFDKSNVRADQKTRIEGNARYLKGNGSVKVVIEGNCDERGTNEYNMALGERRAISSKKYLANLGVAASRINTVSYGEEKPLNYGHDELAWSQNRRDDFVQVQ